MKSLRLILLGAIAVTAACASQRETPAPRPQQQPAVQQPARPAPPPPPPPAADWRDVPLTPGAWYYRDEGPTSQALYGVANAEAQFVVRCDRASRRVVLSRGGPTTGNVMTVRTTSVARSVPVTAQAEPLPYVSGTLAASDRLLDAIAFSRGRFTIEVAGTPMLVIPAWPEAARVVEDCRL